MTLQIIGSGFGRTGTMTMKNALGVLGFGPTHHMTEIMQNPEQVAHWRAIFAGEDVDWNKVFEGYASQVDWPGASRWGQMLEAFPQARVIHTERPEDLWWASFDKTIGKFFANMDDLDLPPEVRTIFETMRGGFAKETFSDVRDKDSCIAAYRENNRRVRELVPADRLLVLDVAAGWEPLCRFLGCAVPDEPFPHNNRRREFWALFDREP